MSNKIIIKLKSVVQFQFGRMVRIAKYFSKALHSLATQSGKPFKQPQDLFVQQHGLVFCSAFPDYPLRPNALGLDNTHATHTSASEQPIAPVDAFWYRLTGHSKGHYSLAIVNRSLANALYRMSNQQACFVPFDNGYNDTSNTDQNTARSRPIVSIVHHYPVITDNAAADLRLIIFFWEETTVPRATVTILNENFDAILVASSFVATALRNSGCAKPIFVIPLGVDHLVDYSAPLMPLTLNSGERFRFLHVSSVFERKGPEFLLSAFFAQFSADDPVELYIKTFPNPHNKIHQQLAQLCENQPNAPRVIIDETDVSNETMRDLYRSSHTLVLPTRGEGFNLPAAEALALGLPVIVTGFGAHTDFCSTTTSSLIPFRFDFSQSHLNTGDGCWVTPEVHALVALMEKSVKDVITNNQALHQRRATGHTLMRTTYTWDQSVQAIANALHCLTTQPAIDDIALKHISLDDVGSTCTDFINFIADNSQPVALVLSWEPSRLDAHFLDNVTVVLGQLNASDTILILELSVSLGTFESKFDRTAFSAFLKLFDRIIVKSIGDLNLMASLCKPSTLILLPDEPDHHSHNDAQSHRNARIKNMALGLKYDLTLSKNSKQ